MNTNIENKLEGYFELFEEIKGRVKDDILARAILCEVSKDRRMEQIREEREIKNGEQATARQLQFMKKLGIEIQPGITKQQASSLIDEELGTNSD